MAPDADLQGDELQRQVLQSTLKEVAARTENEADCCVICLDAISDVCEAVPCGHYNFDYLCATSWLLEQPSCPLCKTAVTKILHGAPGAPNRPATTIEPKKPKDTHYRTAPESLNHIRARACRRPPRRRYPEPERRANSAQSAILERRAIYRARRYSKHVGSNRVSQYRELTPALFCRDEELVSRARMWLRRELQVFSFLSLDDSDADATGQPGAENSSASSSTTTAVGRRRANNAEFLLEYVVAILKSVDIMGSAGQAEDMLSDFLGRENTKLFLHELRAWLRSPFTKLEDWDRAVQYGESQAQRENREQGGTRENKVRGKGDFYRPGRSGDVRDRRDTRHTPYPRNRDREAR
ncbi:hypothetical protein K4F52_002049 [Lecanicillium sp. MT-2017a]|nr:hypothetical protein K4F52_002049 [Lecanicillium sp. MT-2017a]